MTVPRRDILHIGLWTFLTLFLFLFYYATTFQSLHRSIDGCTYASVARSIARGEGCRINWAPTVNFASYKIGDNVEPGAAIGTYSPYGWPIVLSFFFWVFGASDATSVIVCGFFFVLAIPFIYLAAKNLFSEKAAHLCCALYCFNSLFLSYTLLGISENFFFFLIACLIWFASEKKDIRAGVGFGLVLAITAGTKQSGLVWTVPFILMALWNGERKLIRVGAIMGSFLLLFLFAHFAIKPIIAAKKTDETRQRSTSIWQEKAEKIPEPEKKAIAPVKKSTEYSFIIDLIAKSPLRTALLVHSPDFPDHSYPRGLQRPDSAKIISGNLSAYIKRMEINLKRVLQVYFLKMSNPLLMVLGWIGLVGFLFSKHHRGWSLSVLACLVLAPIPNILTFAWPRYLHPALIFFILSAGGLLAFLIDKIPGKNIRKGLPVLIVFVCCLPFGFTAGIDALSGQKNFDPEKPGVLNFLVSHSDPSCLKHRLASKDFSDRLTAFAKERIPPGATLTSDIPSVAAWYADRPTVWLPNDEKTLVQLLARVNLDYILLLFQFDRESYNEYWRQWLTTRAENKDLESGFDFVAGSPTKRGGIYLFSTGTSYQSR